MNANTLHSELRLKVSKCDDKFNKLQLVVIIDSGRITRF